jgi:hypothetical protein
MHTAATYLYPLLWSCHCYFYLCKWREKNIQRRDSLEKSEFIISILKWRYSSHRKNKTSKGPMATSTKVHLHVRFCSAFSTTCVLVLLWTCLWMRYQSPVRFLQIDNSLTSVVNSRQKWTCKQTLGRKNFVPNWK